MIIIDSLFQENIEIFAFPDTETNKEACQCNIDRLRINNRGWGNC